MKPVFVFISDSSDRWNNLKTAFEFADLDFSEFDNVSRAATGKPILVFKHTRCVGYSVSHTDRIEAIGLLEEEREIGIDLEVWPAQQSDPDFLDTLSCPEDVRVLRVLEKSGYNTGIALWVIKEAALKCTGDVMIDPRHLSVTHVAKNVFRVRSSSLARSPHPEIDVSLYALSNEIVLLLGVGMPAGALKIENKFRSVHFSSKGWKVVKFEQ